MGEKPSKEENPSTAAHAQSIEKLQKDIIELNTIIKKYLGEKFVFKIYADDAVPGLFPLFVEVHVQKTINNSLQEWKKMNVKQFYKLYNSIVEYVNAANPSAIRNSFLERSADFVNNQVEQFSDLKECFICMEKPSESMLPCTHAFCSNCIREWRRKSDQCPMCRAVIGKKTDEDWVVLSDSDIPRNEVIRYLSSFLDKK